jgi:hypothetical protein
LVVVALERPPKEVRPSTADAVNIRHFIFDVASRSSIRSADTPVRSLNYEPNTGGPVFFWVRRSPTEFESTMGRFQE